MPEKAPSHGSGLAGVGYDPVFVQAFSVVRGLLHTFPRASVLPTTSSPSQHPSEVCRGGILSHCRDRDCGCQAQGLLGGHRQKTTEQDPGLLRGDTGLGKPGETR